MTIWINTTMKTFLIISVVFSMGCGLKIVADPVGQNDAKTFVKVNILCDKEIIPLGVPIEIRIRIRNTSNFPVRLISGMNALGIAKPFRAPPEGIFDAGVPVSIRDGCWRIPDWNTGETMYTIVLRPRDAFTIQVRPQLYPLGKHRVAYSIKVGRYDADKNIQNIVTYLTFSVILPKDLIALQRHMIEYAEYVIGKHPPQYNDAAILGFLFPVSAPTLKEYLHDERAVANVLAIKAIGCIFDRVKVFRQQYTPKQIDTLIALLLEALTCRRDVHMVRMSLVGAIYKRMTCGVVVDLHERQEYIEYLQDLIKTVKNGNVLGSVLNILVRCFPEEDELAMKIIGSGLVDQQTCRFYEDMLKKHWKTRKKKKVIVNDKSTH